MSQSYFTLEQHEQLLRPINPARVGKDGKGFSHVEAYEIRAHLNRVIGFARWSADVLDQQLIFEDHTAGEKPKWTVAYRTLLRLTICAPDGTVLATYTEGAVGDAQNQPSRADAHDLALKTSESQALKRAAFNLGDNYGLSLFRKGSTAALVGRSLIVPSAGPTAKVEGEAAETAGPVDGHIDEPLPPEDDSAEVDESRPTRTTTAPAATADRDAQRQADATQLRDDLLALAASTDAKAARKKAHSQLMARAAATRTNAVVVDVNGEQVTVGALVANVAKLIVNGEAAA